MTPNWSPGDSVPQPHRAVVARRWPAAPARPAAAPTPPRTPEPVWPCQGVRRPRLAGDRVPQPHRAVVAAGGQQQPARPAADQRHRVHRAGVAGQRGRRRGGRWPGPTAAPCRRRRRWPAASPVRRPNATAYTAPVWPVSGSPTGAPVAGSHSRTVPSWPAVASSVARPGRNDATAYTAPVWPVSGCADRGLAGGRVPQPHRAVVAGGGQQRPPVRAERHRVHRAGVAGAAGRRPGRRWPGPTAAPCRRRRRWPAASPVRG